MGPRKIEEAADDIYTIYTWHLTNFQVFYLHKIGWSKQLQ